MLAAKLLPEGCVGPVGTGPPAARPWQPGFQWTTRVCFDELDAMGMLHNSRYFLLIERATSAFFEAAGWRWNAVVALNPDQYFVVREQSVSYREPIRGPLDVLVEMWLETVGQSSATFCFAVRSADGSQLHAEARRVHVKLDPVSARPIPWTLPLRERLQGLVRPAP